MNNRYVQPLRIAIQWIFLAFMLYLGVRLYLFVQAVRAGDLAGLAPRPDGIEGFLPISGLLGVKDWLVNSTLNSVHPAAVVILLTVVAVSWLLKRSFCSWICPVGTLSELLWKRGFVVLRRNVRPPPWLDRLLRGIKYLLLLFFLSSILWTMPPAAVSGFVNSDYNKIADVRLLDFFLGLSGLPLAIIVVLVILSLPVRNPFCRYLCPYGALLGLVALLSPLKVTRERAACVSCGLCTQVCPAAIPVMAKERVHSEECIGCWRCISYCRAAGALEMKLTGRKVAVNGIVFALLVVGLFWGGTVVGKITGHWRTAIPLSEYVRLLGG